MLFPLHIEQVFEASQSYKYLIYIGGLEILLFALHHSKGRYCSTTFCIHPNNCLEKRCQKLSIINLSPKYKSMRKRLGKINSDFQVVRNHFALSKASFSCTKWQKDGCSLKVLSCHGTGLFYGTHFWIEHKSGKSLTELGAVYKLCLGKRQRKREKTTRTEDCACLPGINSKSGHCFKGPLSSFRMSLKCRCPKFIRDQHFVLYYWETACSGMVRSH